MNPKHSPLQSGRLMRRALPRPGSRRALTMLREYKGVRRLFRGENRRGGREQREQHGHASTGGWGMSPVPRCPCPHSGLGAEHGKGQGVSSVPPPKRRGCPRCHFPSAGGVLGATSQQDRAQPSVQEPCREIPEAAVMFLVFPHGQGWVMGKGMRWRNPLSLQRDFFLLSRHFQLSLELLVLAVGAPHPSQFNPELHTGLGLSRESGWAPLGWALGVSGARPARAGAAKAALDSQLGACMGSRCGKARTAVTTGCKARMRSSAEKPGLWSFFSQNMLRWKQTQKFSFALFRSFPSVSN